MEGVQLWRNTALSEVGCAEIALRLRRDCLYRAEIDFCAEIGLGSCLIFITGVSREIETH